MKDLNFFAGIKKQETKHKMGAFMRGGIIALAVCAGAVGGFYVWQLTQQAALTAEAAAIELKTQQARESSAGYAQLNENTIKLNALKTYNSIIETFDDNLASYPHVDQALMDDINARMPEDVNIVKVDYANNVFKMECSAQNTSSPAEFVRGLRGSALISDVAYNGYYAQDGAAGSETPTGTVTFTVSCALAGGEAK
ncbi:hypothetical protein CE91St36_07510 [Christensenellaceae bacterium]|nr:hypothetical protein CE91St36_07510 [Christensenellaceae bacterium]BDF60602.1 hypothetical protein CE91St37_07520 [Christensenellaceae bacterium]